MEVSQLICTIIGFLCFVCAGIGFLMIAKSQQKKWPRNNLWIQGSSWVLGISALVFAMHTLADIIEQII